MEHRQTGKRMAYSDFTLQKLKKDFGLQVDEQRDLFAAVELVADSDLLNNDTLQKTVQLAIANNTDYYISPNLNKILGILIHGSGLPVPAL